MERTRVLILNESEVLFNFLTNNLSTKYEAYYGIVISL